MSILVSREERKERLKICNACPNLKALTICSQCGCVMTAKTFLADMTCAIGKWDVIKIIKKGEE